MAKLVSNDELAVIGEAFILAIMRKNDQLLASLSDPTEGEFDVLTTSVSSSDLKKEEGISADDFDSAVIEYIHASYGGKSKDA
jgi:hypothetical protein